MRTVIQRVVKASVAIGEDIVGEIQNGYLVLVAIGHDDGESEAAYLARKIAGLRLFEDTEGKMNLGINDIGGEVLVISQFTLYGDVRKGRRPSFTAAAGPDEAEPLYRRFCSLLEGEGIPVQRGVFQAHIRVHLVNDGPVTMWLDTDVLMKSKHGDS